jgi:hypothetical protein
MFEEIFCFPFDKFLHHAGFFIMDRLITAIAACPQTKRTLGCVVMSLLNDLASIFNNVALFRGK